MWLVSTAQSKNGQQMVKNENASDAKISPCSLLTWYRLGICRYLNKGWHKIRATSQLHGCAVMCVKRNIHVYLYNVCVCVYTYACVPGVSVFCGWLWLSGESSFEKILGAIGEFLQHHAPINHFFNQPETPSQHVADKRKHTTLQYKKTPKNKLQAYRVSRRHIAG